MQCEDVARLLPATVEGTPVDLAAQTHIESCLRCQAELARYRRMLRALQQLRTRFLEPSPSLLAQTLAVLGVLTWGRRRLPVLRADRYAEFAWVVLIPLSVCQALVPALVDLTR